MNSASSANSFSSSSSPSLSSLPRTSVKCEYEGDLRRFSLPPSGSLEALYTLLKKVYKLEPGFYRLVYRDEDDDLITITSDDDLLEGLLIVLQLEKPLLRLVVYPSISQTVFEVLESERVTFPSPAATPSTPLPAPPPHAYPCVRPGPPVQVPLPARNQFIPPSPPYSIVSPPSMTPSPSNAPTHSLQNGRPAFSTLPHFNYHQVRSPFQMPSDSQPQSQPPQQQSFQQQRSPFKLTPLQNAQVRPMQNTTGINTHPFTPQTPVFSSATPTNTYPRQNRIPFCAANSSPHRFSSASAQTAADEHTMASLSDSTLLSVTKASNSVKNSLMTPSPPSANNVDSLYESTADLSRQSRDTVNASANGIIQMQHDSTSNLTADVTKEAYAIRDLLNGKKL